MLPSVMTARSTITAALAALTIAAVPATPARAWSDREQGFVTGVAAALIVDQIIRQSRKAREVRPAPGFSFVEPRPTNVTPRPSPSTSVYATTAAQAFNSYSVSERRNIQRTLRAWGYYRGSIDGTFGPGTYSAVTDYARDEGLASSLATPTGAYAVYDGLLF
jgi:hypothetical protein